MDSVIEKLHEWMKMREGEHLEFKEAKNGIPIDKLTQYCCALANEKGGRVVLGVSDRFPRMIVGTNACDNLAKTKSDLISRLQIRIDVTELRVEKHENARVLIFDVPSRPIGVPIQFNGIYWMRRGEELVSMTQDMLQRIFHEGEPDFSAQICPKATLSDLDLNAVEQFRNRWQTKSGNRSLSSLTIEQLLADADLISERGVTLPLLFYSQNSNHLENIFLKER